MQDTDGLKPQNSEEDNLNALLDEKRAENSETIKELKSAYKKMLITGGLIFIATNIFTGTLSNAITKKIVTEDVKRNKLNGITNIYNKDKAKLLEENKSLLIENKNIALFKDKLEICDEASKEKDYQMSALRDSIQNARYDIN